MFTAVAWPELPDLLTTEAATDALGLSLRTATLSTVLALVLGVPIAHLLAQPASSRGAGWVQQFFYVVITLPMVLPPVVAGLALLTTLGKRTPLGGLLHQWGIDIAFTTVAVVVAQTFVAMPFVIISLTGALRTRGMEYERTARDLGASRSRIFWQITLPLTWPAVASGAALTLARALGEFGATLTFAGSLQGTTRTLPLEIYLQREVDTNLALALAVVLLAVAMVVIAITTVVVTQTPVADHTKSSDDSSLTQDQALLALARVAAVEPSTASISVSALVNERAVNLAAEIPTGAVTAIIGPNGAGKSTLLNVLGGALNYRGEIGLPPQLTDLRVAWLHQRALLFPHLSVADNVAFPLLCQTKSAGTWFRWSRTRRQIRERAIAQLKIIGCDHLANRRPHQLSGGQAQRIAIARALMIDPDLVLLDEPLAAIDSSVAWSLRVLLKQQLRSRGCTAVIVTHDLADVRSLADQILVMESGQVIAAGSLEELMTRPPSPFTTEFFGLTTTSTGKIYRPEDVRVYTAEEVADRELASLSEDTGQCLRMQATVVDYPPLEFSNTALVRTGEGATLLVSRNAYTAGSLRPGERIYIEVPYFDSVTAANA
ncbi:MAG: ABC transporter permease [Actinomycetaceae bacterium]|nr:ABC transporter permease [Actinomycetaceae bacterium]